MFGPEYFNTVGHRTADTGEVVCQDCIDSDELLIGEWEEIKEAAVTMPCALTCDRCDQPLVEVTGHVWSRLSNLQEECVGCGEVRFAEKALRRFLRGRLTQHWSREELIELVEDVADDVEVEQEPAGEVIPPAGPTPAPVCPHHCGDEVHFGDCIDFAKKQDRWEAAEAERRIREISP